MEGLSPPAVRVEIGIQRRVIGLFGECLKQVVQDGCLITDEQ